MNNSQPKPTLKMKQDSKEKRMKMKLLLVMTLAITAAIAATAQTQGKAPSATDMAARHVKKLTTLLTLGTAQQQQATTIYTTAATSEQSLHESEKQTHDSLRTAIKGNDTAMIDQLSNSIAQTAAQLTSVRAKADAAFYQILTADQQAKLSELENEHMGPLDAPGGPPAMGFR
jgi:Spy/CpxP family protein refolding chaperone